MTLKSYRQEMKQLLSPTQTYLLEQRISAILPLDNNSNSSGNYSIRSIYFDTPADSAYWDKISGIDNREKIRIRFYGLDSSVIKLERKEKRNNLIHKDSFTIGKETADRMLACDYASLLSYEHPLAEYIYSLSRSSTLKPVVVVDYVRKAYTYPVGNVRITFDTKLQGRSPEVDIWTPGPLSNVLGENNILEIKFNQYLPEHIRQILCSVPGQRMALSKYALCRENLLQKQGNFLLGK